MFKTWFGGGNAPDLTSKTKVTDRFSSLKTFLARKKAAEENIYTGILTTYGVRWTLEKAARDIWQNFFDYNKTLDCVQTEVKESKEGRVLRISNGATYDYRMLLHLGGTDKVAGVDVGGFGEGTKILSLVLLRDYGFKSVKFACEDWQVEFHLDTVPIEKYPLNSKGLFAKITHGHPQVIGNYIELVAQEMNSAATILQAKNLFFHSENKDFLNPTFDVKGQFGFKLLTGEKQVASGNLYVGGQRVHYLFDSWNTLNHFNLWLYKADILPKDRDRARISQDDLAAALGKTFEKTHKAKLEDALFSIKPIWHDINAFETSYCFFEKLVDRLAKLGSRPEFEEQYLAEDTPFNPSINSALKAAGYTLVPKEFAGLGMKTTSQRYKEMQSHMKLKPTREEKARIRILQRAAKLLKKENKEVFIFDTEEEKSAILGQHADCYVWISRQVLSGSFHEALATYVHELDHKYGSDQSAEFSYALTDSMAEIIRAIMAKPEAFAKLKERLKKHSRQAKSA